MVAVLFVSNAIPYGHFMPVINKKKTGQLNKNDKGLYLQCTLRDLENLENS